MKFSSHSVRVASCIFATLAATPAFSDTVVISDNYTAANVTSGFTLGNGVNSDINPPATRMTGTAAPNLRYILTAGTKPTTLFDINGNRLRIAVDPTANNRIGRFTFSSDGSTPFDFAPALGTAAATPANPIVYDIRISMRNNASGTQRFSFALGTVEGDAFGWDFAVQLYRAVNTHDFYTIQKRIDQGSRNGATTVGSATGDINTSMATTASGTWVSGSQATINFLIRVTDAGSETGSSYNSRVQVSTDAGATWIYDTSSNLAELPNGWRLDGAGRYFIFDQAGNDSGAVFYDNLSVTLVSPTWGGGGADDNWSTGANWGRGIKPTTGEDVVFTGATRAANVNDLSGLSLNSIQFAAGGFSVTGNALNLASAITNVTGNNTMDNDLTLTGALSARTTAGSLLLSGDIGGASGSLTKVGSGTLTLSGANSYSGATAVSAGTVVVSGSLGASSAVSVAAAGTLAGTGTVNGPVSVSGTLSAGASVGTLTTGAVTLNSGGTNVWEISSATGTAGTDWDLVDAGANNVDVQATSGVPFTFKLAAVGLNNFNHDSSYSWAAIAGSVQNFAADKFAVDYAGFTNDLAGGTFLIEPGSLNVRFTNNHAPIASIATYGFPKGIPMKPAKLSIASFLASNTADPDGDGRSLLLVTSTNAVVSTNATDITIGSMSDSGESLQYVVRDARNYRLGDTIRTATNYIHLVRTNATGAVNISAGGGGSINVSFYGIPNYQYIIQRSPDLSDWTDVTTNAAPANGLLQYTETPPWNPTFYRVRIE